MKGRKRPFLLAMKYTDTLFTRFLLTMLLGILSAIVINEVSFLFLRSENGRAATEFNYLIPAGTADKIAAGEEVKIIPNGKKFVIGDRLTIENRDNKDHNFGDLFIPAGSSASMVFSLSNNYAYSCSFQSETLLGFEVYEPVSFWLRLGGILLAGIPLGMLYWIYGILVFPIKKEAAHEA